MPVTRPRASIVSVTAWAVPRLTAIPSNWGPDGCDPTTVITLNDEPGGVSQPQVCGLIDTLPGPMPIYTFKGLPYAAPPVEPTVGPTPSPVS